MKSTFITLFLIVIFSTCIFAQTKEISGTISDINGAAVAGASVVLRNTRTGLERVVETDEQGNFTFKAEANSEYEVIVNAAGFESFTQTVGAEKLDVKLSVSSLKAETTVYSGSRQAELQESLNAKVEVVTRQEIRDTGYETVGEVLKEIPGVQTRLGSDTGSTSAVAGEQIQGIGSRQALVLLDGFPIIAARGIKSGNINLDRQSVGRIEQIEVVKGAASALYGSDAIGGVVNLITREPNKPLEGTVTLSGGSFGVFDPRAELGFKKNNFGGFLSVSRTKRNEFDLTPTTFDTTGAGFNRENYFAKLKYEFSPEFNLVGLADIYTGDAKGRSLSEPFFSQNPNVPPMSLPQFDHIKDTTQNYGLTANWTPNARTVFQARGYFSRYDEIGTTTLTDGSSFADDNLFQRFGRFDASALYIWGERQIVQVGTEFTTDRYSGFNRLRNNSGERADTRTVWGQDKINLTNWATLTLGLRYDDHSIFGSAVSPKVGLNIRATDRINLRASWGRGFRAPDLGQLYYRFYNVSNFYQVFGNPNLRPEHSGSWQAGAEYSSTKKTYRFGVNFFRNDVKNLIEAENFGFVFSTAQANGILRSQGLDPADYTVRLFRLLLIYNNISNVYTQGVEADFDIKLPKDFVVSGAYTYLDARNKETDEYLPERIRNQAFLKLAYNNQKLGFRGNIRAGLYSGWAASSLSNRALQTELKSEPFELFDIYGAKTIKSGFEVFGSVENLFDNRDANIGKFDSFGRPLPIVRPDIGRTFRVGIRYSFSRD